MSNLHHRKTTGTLKGTDNRMYFTQQVNSNTPFDSLPSSLWGLFLLPFACRCLSSSSCSSGVGQTLLICGDDVVVKPLVELSDDVTPIGGSSMSTRHGAQHAVNSKDTSRR